MLVSNHVNGPSYSTDSIAKSVTDFTNHHETYMHVHDVQKNIYLREPLEILYPSLFEEPTQIKNGIFIKICKIFLDPFNKIA